MAKRRVAGIGGGVWSAHIAELTWTNGGEAKTILANKTEGRQHAFENLAGRFASSPTFRFNRGRRSNTYTFQHYSVGHHRQAEELRGELIVATCSPTGRSVGVTAGSGEGEAKYSIFLGYPSSILIGHVLRAALGNVGIVFEGRKVTDTSACLQCSINVKGSLPGGIFLLSGKLNGRHRVQILNLREEQLAWQAGY
ncbi:hypothetical protein MJO29_011353 [Puccinia striiformis f. sp. tritici]|nr:hypothetical protein MJO29_011353 [Puccinia striiformis f. sp. tritici]